MPGTAIADGFRWAGRLHRSTAHKCALQSALRTGCQSPLTSAHSSEQAELFFEGEVEDLRKEAPPEEEPQLKLSLVICLLPWFPLCWCCQLCALVPEMRLGSRLVLEREVRDIGSSLDRRAESHAGGGMTGGEGSDGGKATEDRPDG